MKNEQGLVSIVTPHYNRAELLAETIRSVIAQTYANWEMIIVDDGSASEVITAIEDLVKVDERIRLLHRNRLPKGVSTARNIGIEAAKGEYLIFLDSDDLLAPTCLEQRIAMAEKLKGLDYYVFQMQEFVDRPGDRQELFFYKFSDDHLAGSLIQGCQWGPASPFWRRSSLLRIGLFKEGLLSSEDWELQVRAFIYDLQFKVFDTIDSYSRKGRPSLTSKAGSKEHLLSKIDLYDDVFLQLKEAKKHQKYKDMLAGKCMALTGDLYKVGESELGKQVWKNAWQRGIISDKTYKIGLTYIPLQWQLTKTGMTVFSKALRKMFSMLLPKYIIWAY